MNEAFVEQVTAIIEEHLVCECGSWAEDMHENCLHAAQQIRDAMRAEGIVGFIRNDVHVKPRIYTDADAEAWSDV